MNRYIFFALISMFLFGVNSLIQKKAPGIDSISLSLITLGTAFIIILIIWLINFNNKILSLKGSAYGITAGLVFSIAFFLFIYSLRIGKLQVVIILNGMSAGVTILLSFLILRESLSFTQIIGILLGFMAIVLFNI